VNVGAQGTALLKAALVDRTPELLDAAIAQLQAAVRECPSEDVDVLTWRANLGAALRTRHERTGNVGDLDEAITFFREVVAGSAAGDPALPGRLGNLGLALHDRYLSSRNHADLDEAIRVLTVAAATATSSSFVQRATNLGNALLDRFALRHDTADLDLAVSWQRRAVGADGTFTAALANLAAALHARYEYRRERADLDEALTAAEAAVEASGQEHPKRLMYLSTVGVLYHIRYEQIAVVADLETAIAALTEAEQFSASAGPAERALCLTALGHCRRARHLRLGTAADLDEAIKCYRAAITSTSANDPDRPGRLSALAVALDDLPHGHTDQQDEALRLHEEATRSCDTDHPKAVSIVANYGRGLLTRFDRYGVVADCSAAVAKYRLALHLAGVEHLDRPHYLALLGLALRSRHSATGDAADVHEAVAVLREAVEATAADDPNRASYCSYLGAALRARYTWYGEPADLDDSIEWHDAALAALPNSHAEASSVLSHRAYALRLRAGHTGADIEAAIDACRLAVDAETNAGLRPTRLAQLGAALDLREHTRENLDETIAVRREVCTLCQPHERYRGPWLSDLANSLRNRASLTGDHGDLDEAHRLHLEAVEVTDPQHPEYATVLSNLAGSFRDRYVRDGDGADLTAALDQLRRAAGLQAAPATRRFVAARTWAEIAAQTERWASAGAGYAMAISLLPIAA
jgi:tetratricopeptide (TPR) repeat protein